MEATIAGQISQKSKQIIENEIKDESSENEDQPKRLCP